MDAAPEFELQQELERFATRFADRISQAMGILERATRPGVCDEALRKGLLYVSSAMEIAAGLTPEVNLLDMIVFVRLSRTVLEHHWIPQLYHEEGRDLAEAFTRSEQDLASIAAQTLSRAQREELASVADAWLAENPDQVRVEGVRLADFSSAAGSAAAERFGQTRGLLSSVKAATRTANQAMLLSERALFLLHRMPFLWRLQARIAARQMFNDAIAQLFAGPQAFLPRVTRQARRLALRGALYVGLVGGVGMLLWRLRRLGQR